MQKLIWKSVLVFITALTILNTNITAQNIFTLNNSDKLSDLNFEYAYTFEKLGVNQIDSTIKNWNTYYYTKLNDHTDKQVFYYFKSKILFQEQHRSTNFYLLSTPIDYMCEVYFNNKLLFTRGSKYPNHTHRVLNCEYYLIPPDQIKYDSINTVTVVLTRDISKFNGFRGLQVGNLHLVNNRKQLIDFANTGFTLASLVYSVIVFLFLLAIFINSREKKEWKYLYFGILSLTFGLSYLNTALTSNSFAFFLVEKISRASIAIMLLSVLLFLMEFNELRITKKVYRFIIALPYFIFAFLFAFSTDYPTINTTYRIFLSVMVLPSLLLYIVIPTIGIIRKLTESRLAMLFLFSGIFFSGLYDVLNFMSGLRPLIQALPFAYAITLTSIMFILAFEYAQTNKDLAKSKHELAAVNKTMEQTIEKRTKELDDTNKALQEELGIKEEAQIKLAAAANELQNTIVLKDKFLSLIAHDLKNPLNQIINLSDILRLEYKDYSEALRLEYLNILNRSALNLFQLLENLLEWARSQSGKKEFAPQDIIIDHVLESTIDILEQNLKSKNIRIKKNTDVNLNIYADYDMLFSILRNIVGNAIKFSKPYSEIKINTSESELYITIEIEDSGIGIDQEKIDKLFRIDSKISTPGTEGEVGTGLGLIICKEFIDKHNGKIVVKSQINIGTSFKLQFPKNKFHLHESVI